MYFLPPTSGLSCLGKGFVSRLHLAASWSWTPLHICFLWHISRLQQSFWVHRFLALQTISLPGGLRSPPTWAFFCSFWAIGIFQLNSCLPPTHTHTFGLLAFWRIGTSALHMSWNPIYSPRPLPCVLHVSVPFC
jgi:hypothetical protein